VRPVQDQLFVAVPFTETLLSCSAANDAKKTKDTSKLLYVCW
jgi:hypothetical protein